MGFAAAMVVAMMADAALGWPKGLFVLVGHPVTWFGKLIDLLDAGLEVETLLELICWRLRGVPLPPRVTTGSSASWVA